MFNYEKLNALINEKGIKKTALAEKIGKNQSIFTDWKKGKSEPKEEYIEIIASLLDTTVAYLTDQTDQKEKPTTELSGERLENFNLFVRKLKEHGLDLDTASEQDIDCWINIISSAKSVFDK
ncbi:MAG: helix-turn-helix transcriptional regulator [Evtepia sp.]